MTESKTDESKLSDGPLKGSKQKVFDYYNRNWKGIVNCYDIGDDGLPVDPAFYRRLIYLRILAETGADNILDIGCGSGRTVLDAFEMNRQVHGIEPVEPLLAAAQGLLRENGHDPNVVKKGAIQELSEVEANSYNAVSVLSVLPHIERADWDGAHSNMARLLRPGGYFIASYRNDLFDLYTFNSFTVDFIVNSLWNCDISDALRTDDTINALKKLMQNPDVPGPTYTRAKDAAFGTLTRVNSNPLEMAPYLAGFGLELKKTYFFNYHCVPPLLSDSIKDYRLISHRMNLEMSENWRGNFEASTFVVLAQKPE